jgi:hypothetical protein
MILTGIVLRYDQEIGKVWGMYLKNKMDSTQLVCTYKRCKEVL